jgi:hypothetical protein
VTEKQKPIVKEVREQLMKVVQDKHDETLAKLGAILVSFPFLLSSFPQCLNVDHFENQIQDNEIQAKSATRT